MKNAADCTSIADVREAVDAIDRDIVRLLGERAHYVRAAVPFKRSEADIRSPDHMPAFIEKRRAWALQQGEDSDFVARLYRVITEHSVTTQTTLWRSNRPS